MASEHVRERSALTNRGYEVDEPRLKDLQNGRSEVAEKFGNDGDLTEKGQSHGQQKSTNVNKEKTNVFTNRKILVAGIVMFGLFVAVVALAMVLLLRGNASVKTGPDEIHIECVPEARKPPHIVFFLADDLGWHDVGYNNPEMITPNIDRLAAEGVIFNQAYAQPQCSPSRSCLMSGYYPFRTGMQHQILQPLSPYGLPTDFTLLPEALKPLGYNSHMIGKWHLGMCKEAYLPFYRGFDSYYGFLNSYIGYYDRTNQDVAGLFGTTPKSYKGYDFWDNSGVVLDNTTYISYLLNKRAEELIDNHKKDTPMFLYYASPLPHFPLDVPEEYENLYAGHRNRNRRIYNGMVSIMDEVIGNVTNKLKDNGMWENTLFVFMSDNGGTPFFGGYNYPLRGTKTTLFEGGTRVITFAAGGALKKTGYVNDGLIHITDWYPTFVSLAGGKPDQNMDGKNLWDAISKGKESLRDEIVYNIVTEMPARGAAIRVGDWKLIEGNHQSAYPYVYAEDGWYLPPTENNQSAVPPIFVPGGGRDPPPIPDVEFLFNLTDDPNEHHDLSAEEPEKVAELKARLDYHRSRGVPALHPPPNFDADPDLTGGIWRTGFC